MIANYHPPPKSSRPSAVVATATRSAPGEDSMHASGWILGHNQPNRAL